MENKENTIGFALANITTEKFEVIESNLPAEGEEIGIKMNFRFSANAAQKMLAVFTSFTFQAGEKPFMIIEGGCQFDIQPGDWDGMLNGDKTELIVPRDLLSSLTTLTVGTTRGILHARTESTAFNSFHLPIINVSGIVNSDSVFRLKD